MLYLVKLWTLLDNIIKLSILVKVCFICGPTAYGLSNFNTMVFCSAHLGKPFLQSILSLNGIEYRLNLLRLRIVTEKVYESFLVVRLTR